MITKKEAREIAKRMMAECEIRFQSKPKLAEVTRFVEIYFLDEPPAWNGELLCDERWIPMHSTALYNESGCWYTRFIWWMWQNYPRRWNDETERWVAA